MALAQIASILALRRLTEGASGSSGVLTSQATSAGRLLADYPDIALPALCRATRHAWLSLEMALAGPRLWEQIGSSITHAQGNVLRQQLDAFVDILSLAGLPCDDLDWRRRCLQELSAARRAKALEIAPAEAQAEPEGIFLNTVPEGGSEWQSIQRLASDLEQSQYPELARLVGLRSPWKEPLFLGVHEHFLRRALEKCPELEGELTTPSDDGLADWRCLERTARLLEEREAEVTALLDRPEEADAKPAADAQAVEKLCQMGLTRLQHGDYQQAVLHFTAALKLDPTRQETYSRRGEAYRLQCEYERAIADYNLALRLGGKSAAILVGRAIAHHLGGEQDQAIFDCTAALELEPNHATAYRTRAAARAELGDHDLALVDLTQAITLAPEDVEALYLRGLIQARKREFSQAIADFNRTIEINSYHVLAHLHRGHAFRCRNDHVQAIRDYSEVLRHHPGNVIALSGRGLAYKFKGEPDRAIADFSEALRLEPENGQIYFHRGALYRAKGDLGRAQADLDEAIRRQPENWAALYHRAKIAIAQGQFALALFDLSQVVHLNPKVVVGFLSRALANDRLGKHEDALEDTTRALALDANSPAAHLIRGVVYAHTGEYAAAIGNLSKAIALDARFALAYHERCSAYTLQKEHERALADANQLIALEPRNAQAYALRSIIHHFMGEVQEAMNDYSRALQIDPARIMTGFNQGLAESARSQTTQRVADYIDGVRPETAAGEAPPPPEFRIIVKPAGAAAEPAPRPPEAVQPVPPPIEKSDKPARGNRTATIRLAAPETAAMPALTDDTAAVAPTPIATSAKPRPKSAPAPSANGNYADRPAKPKKAAETKPADEEAALKLVDDDAAIKIESAETAAADSVEFTVEGDVAIDSPESMDETQLEEFAIQALLDEPSPTPEPAPAPPPTPRPALADTSPFKKAYSAAIESALNNAAEPAPAKKEPKAATPRPKLKKVDDDEEETLFQKWKKPLPMGITVAAAALLIYLCLPGASGRVTVFPAHGKAEFEGQPIPNAAIFLHPVGVKDPNFPRPRATVDKDGTFVVGTYKRGDGAPPGEYKLTVQWFQEREAVGADVGEAMPVNVLPARYGNAESSGITVQIQEGENELPPIKLKY